jgi:hypothetical protein
MKGENNRVVSSRGPQIHEINQRNKDNIGTKKGITLDRRGVEDH